MSKSEKSRQKAKQPLKEFYDYELLLSEATVAELIAGILGERGYIITSVSLDYDEQSDEIYARCTGNMRKVISTQDSAPDADTPPPQP